VIVYKVTNLINGKIYIGQTVRTVERRQAKHIEAAKSGTYALNNAMRKHGVENFVFETLFHCLSKEEMDRKEIETIKTMGSKVPHGYNLTDGGEGSVGFKHSAESRARMSRAHRGVIFTDERKAKISVAGRGLKRSAETRAKISAAKKIWNPSMLGKKHTDETKKKLRMLTTGKKRSEEFCRRNSELKKGIILSAEHRAKISAGLLGNTNTLGRKYSLRKQAA
jgi:group I intron endonuclease